MRYLNLFKKEFKWNLIAFLIWTAVFVGFVFMYVPMTNLLLEDMDEMMSFIEKLPDVFLKIFNFEPEIVSKPEGLFGSEGMSFVYILSAIFSATLAGSFFAKEFENKTIEYLLLKPVKRRSVFCVKSAVMLLDLLLLSIIFLIFILYAFDTFIDIAYSVKVLYAFGLYTLAVLVFFGGLSTMISIMAKKSSLNTSLSVGVVLFMYFGDTLGRSFEHLGWLAKISIFNYIPLVDTIKNDRIYTLNSLIIIAVGLGFMSIAYWLFEKMDVTT